MRFGCVAGLQLEMKNQNEKQPGRYPIAQSEQTYLTKTNCYPYPVTQRKHDYSSSFEAISDYDNISEFLLNNKVGKIQNRYLIFLVFVYGYFKV